MGIMGVRVVPFFPFIKEVQSNILSGQAGDSVPFAAGTIELPAHLKGTISSIEHPCRGYVQEKEILLYVKSLYSQKKKKKTRHKHVES